MCFYPCLYLFLAGMHVLLQEPPTSFLYTGCICVCCLPQCKHGKGGKFYLICSFSCFLHLYNYLEIILITQLRCVVLPLVETCAM